MTLKRTPLKRGKPLARGTGFRLRDTPMPRRKSARLKQDERELEKATAIVHARSGGRCEFGIRAVCTKRAEHVHHRQRRRSGNHTAANLADVCRPCHDYAHGHPTVAYIEGWLVRSEDDPALIAWTVGR